MSLLDSIGSLFNSSSQQGGGQQALVSAALNLVNSHPGGLGGLVQKFQQAGAGDIIQSWVGNGTNQPISADQLHSVLGSDTITNLAQKMGVQPGQVTGLLSQVLPHVINAATPAGEVPQNGQINIESVLGLLGGAGGALGALSGLASSFLGGKGGDKTT